MLTIAQRTYDLVQSRSGFCVELDPFAEDGHQQKWRMEAHFVPAVESS